MSAGVVQVLSLLRTSEKEGHGTDSSQEMGDIKLEKLKPKISPKACVIMVGSTNTGKSTTVNIMTKSTDCPEGEDTNAKPCTQKLHAVEDKATGLIYMDNPGQLLTDILSSCNFM